jgi:hypothetical protein
MFAALALVGLHLHVSSPAAISNNNLLHLGIASRIASKWGWELEKQGGGGRYPTSSPSKPEKSVLLLHTLSALLLHALSTLREYFCACLGKILR